MDFLELGDNAVVDLSGKCLQSVRGDFFLVTRAAAPNGFLCAPFELPWSLDQMGNLVVGLSRGLAPADGGDSGDICIISVLGDGAGD
jgi:hypothetical protein